MKRIFLAISLIAAISIYLIACNNAAANDGIELKFKLPKGKKYEYAMDMQMQMNRQMMGKQLDIKNDMGFTYLFEVVNDSANWKTISSTISKVTMDMDAMGRTIHYDSDMANDTTEGPGAFLGKIFGAMKGTNFSFELNDKGEMGEIKGLKEMREKMMEKFPNAKESPLNSATSSFDEQGTKQNFEQVFGAYPGKRVKPGDAWTKTITQKLSGLLVSSENTFTLESVKGNDAIVKVISKMSLVRDTANNNRQMTMTGGGQGTSHYDIESGIITDGNMDIKMDMKMAGEKTENPMTLTMKMKVKGKKI